MSKYIRHSNTKSTGCKIIVYNWLILFHSFVVVVLVEDCSHPGDGKESPIATSEGMPCILIWASIV